MASTRLVTVPLVAIVLASWASVLSAQETPPVLTVTEIKVKASMVAEWEDARKERTAMLRRHERPYPFTTLETEDHRYLFLTPVEDLADFERWVEANRLVNERVEAAGGRPRPSPPGSVEYTKRWWVQAEPDWSYTPENPRLSAGEINFVHLDTYCGTLPLGGQSFTRQLITLYRASEIRDGFNVYRSHRATGPEGPCLTISRSGRNRDDFNERAAQIQSTLGPEVSALMGRWMTSVRTYEAMELRIRRDLSYEGPD